MQQKAGIGSLGCGAPHLLIVKGRKHLALRSRFRFRQCSQSRVDHRQIVNPGCRDKLLPLPSKNTFLILIQKQLIIYKIRHFYACLLLQQCGQILFLFHALLLHGKERQNFGLSIAGSFFILVPVEMNAEIRNHKNRLINLHQLFSQHALFSDNQPPGQRQRSVKPCLQNRPAVYLHIHLHIAVRRNGAGARLDLEPRRIRVCAYNAKTFLRQIALSHRKGNQGRAVFYYKISAAFFQ